MHLIRRTTPNVNLVFRDHVKKLSGPRRLAHQTVPGAESSVIEAIFVEAASGSAEPANNGGTLAAGWWKAS